ncbi:Retrovirus-related Pol polyprotein from transposon TNT 1-94 [Vitis vinifera]|uniref:Retrovirus-related Pol polyprotein from transposon TNT 1-94 n=1 Tax=Vitis vinifera TaxID=29760 RepID=A0A438GH31_VITVI|nr:Retrovirus-related Pol polyprotein from transposon TNT 1-94 [Vitis vinifera]
MGSGKDAPSARIVEIWVIGSKNEGKPAVALSEAQLKQLLSLLNNQDENSSSKVNAVTKPGSGYEEDDCLGKQRDGLYYLVALATEKSLTNHSSSTNQPACNLAISSTDLWHSRLGHVSPSRLSFIAKNFLNFLFSPIMLALYVLWLSKVVYLLPMPPMFTPLTNLITVPCHPFFIGYPVGQKAYKLFDLSTKKVFTSRDVKFHEDIFPYVSLKPNSTLPSLTHNSGPIPLVAHDISSSFDSTSHALSPLLSNHTSTPSPATENDDFSSPSQPSELIMEPSSQIDPNPSPSPSTTLVSPFSGPPFASIPYKPAYRSFVAQHSAVTEPRSYSEAAAHPEWQKAMRSELQALQANDTCLSLHFRPARHRLDTFSPTAKIISVRCLLALAAARGWSIHQMDVNNAFLHGDLHEEIYMSPPLGLRRQGEENLVCRLHKSLYGLKQTSRQWFAKFSEAIQSAGYAQSRPIILCSPENKASPLLPS